MLRSVAALARTKSAAAARLLFLPNTSRRAPSIRPLTELFSPSAGGGGRGVSLRLYALTPSAQYHRRRSVDGGSVKQVGAPKDASDDEVLEGEEDLDDEYPDDDNQVDEDEDSDEVDAVDEDEDSDEASDEDFDDEDDDEQEVGEEEIEDFGDISEFEDDVANRRRN